MRGKDAGIAVAEPDERYSAVGLGCVCAIPGVPFLLLVLHRGSAMSSCNIIICRLLG